MVFITLLGSLSTILYRKYRGNNYFSTDSKKQKMENMSPSAESEACPY